MQLPLKTLSHPHPCPLPTPTPAGDKSKLALIRSGWGDEEADLAPLNPHYEEELYGHQPQAVRRNLARLDEEAIDLDLLEEVVYHIDTTQVGAGGDLSGCHRGRHHSGCRGGGVSLAARKEPAPGW
jgi:hypothetical protein